MPSYAPAFSTATRTPHSARRARAPQSAARDAAPYVGESRPGGDASPADTPQAVPQADGHP
jgi:hypothetical protein